jgi:RNA polymerase sigma factor (sigma-70 family)
LKSGEDARQSLCEDLARVANGDHRAMRHVYDQTSAKLYAICLRVVKDRAGAEDALQDVYVKIWRSAARFDADRASPITWLCAIARNTSIDRLRASGRTTTHHGEMPENIADDAPSADIVMVRHEEAVRVHECIGLLDARQARCIRAAFFDGDTYVQLADRHKVPLGTMKSWIRRGLLRLRECMDDA